VKNILLLIFIAIGQIAWSQSDAKIVPADSSIAEEEKEFVGEMDTVQIQQRAFHATTLDSLKANPNFDYKQPPTVAETLWSRFLRWLSEFFESLVSGALNTDFGRILIYVVGLVVICIVIMMLLKVNAFKVFYSGADVGKVSASFFSENIHEMDFEQLIQAARQKQDYRQATRLVLLYALKMLSDKHLIHWQAGKTNHDYVEELKPGDLRKGLGELSFYFDYAWYGNFAINEQTFGRVENTFADWRKKINA
jgi:hypothetical protein